MIVVKTINYVIYFSYCFFFRHTWSFLNNCVLFNSLEYNYPVAWALGHEAVSFRGRFLTGKFVKRLHCARARYFFVAKY